MLLTLACVMGLFYPVSAGTEAEMRALMDSKLNSTGYSSRVRPIADTGNVMKLTVDMYLIGINGISEVEQKMQSTAYLRVSWNDTFLTWTPADHGNIDKIYLPQNRIWKPDLALSNAFDSISGLGDAFIYLVVDNNGVIEWQPYQVFESTCDMDMTYFPFDKQTCDLEMVTWSSTKEMIEIVLGSDGFNIASYEKNANWDLLGVSTMDTSSSSTSAMTFRLNLKRKPLYFLINFILPIVLLSILNVFVFILPCDSGEKTGYAMVLFLSFAIFLLVVTDIMPEGMKTVPVLSTYLLLMCVFSTLYVFVVIIQLRLHNLGDDVQIPRYLRAFTSFVLAFKAKICCTSDKTSKENEEQSEDSESEGDSVERGLKKKMKAMGVDEPEVTDKESVKMNKLSRRNSIVKDLLYNRRVSPSQVFHIGRPETVDKPYGGKDLHLEDSDDVLFDDGAKNAKGNEKVPAAKRQNLVEGGDGDNGSDKGDDDMSWSNVSEAMDNFFFVFSILLNGLTTAVAVIVSIAGDA